MKKPPTCGSLKDILSVISDAGVIGYPPKNLQPAIIAPSVIAKFPCAKNLPERIADAKIIPPFSVQYI